jgi:hypothetical protein
LGKPIVIHFLVVPLLDHLGHPFENLLHIHRGLHNLPVHPVQNGKKRLPDICQTGGICIQHFQCLGRSFCFGRASSVGGDGLVDFGPLGWEGGLVREDAGPRVAEVFRFSDQFVDCRLRPELAHKQTRPLKRAWGSEGVT